VRILLADDQPSIRSALTLLLEQQTDMPVAGEAADADSLLKWLTANRADVLLLDWDLPGISGKDIITILRSLSPDMKIIVMDSSPQTKQPAMEAGAHDFVSKGEPPEILLAALNNVLPETGEVRKTAATPSEGNRDFGLSGFNRINISAALRLELVPSETYHISSSPEDYEFIRAEKSGDKLTLTRRGFSWASLFHDQPKVIVEMPELRELVAVGGCRVIVRDFHLSQILSVEVIGASQVEMSDIDTSDIRIKATGACRLTGSLSSSGRTNIDLTGASNVDLTGSAQYVNLFASGASHAHLDRFIVTDMDVKLSGASHSTININGKLNVHLTWLGNPILGDIDITGSSQIHRK
jgi:DNA-binding response OmpR family regulator